ncbi:MAG: hypothetical protein J6V11_03515, partial [Alphaproteobacteria bacterium]|nr:hypothetical protein [Alphaproteobacteria bacterium]
MNLKHKNEDGRSMVEMLGTLAIIGVLSIGGIAGYSYGMNKYKANTIIQDIMLRATDAIAQYDATGDANLSEWPTTTAEKYTIGLEEETIGIQVDGLPAQLCEMVYDAIKDKADVKFNGIISDESTPVDCSNTNSMVFYVDNTIDIARGEQTTPPTECTTHDDCKAEGVCMGCIIEDGQETGHCEYACQELEYLESDGGQYIDTGVLVDNPHFRFELKFYPNNGSNRRLLQAKNFTYTQDWLSIPISETELSSGSISRPSANNTHVAIFENNSFILDGVTQQLPSGRGVFDENPTTTLKLCSFGDPAQYAHERFAGRVYSVKLNVGGKLLRNLIPVLDPEGTPAMLDKVEEKLYYNQGSGQF